MANSDNDFKKFLKEKLKGRTPEQQKVIKYFLKPEGCLSKNISDEEYWNMVQTKLKSLNLRQKAISKIGLDESEIKEIEPIHIEGFVFDDKKSYWKKGKDNLYRSSMFQQTWIFFSDTQVYQYQYTFNMDEDGKREHTEEFFYRDIVNFTSTEETIDNEQWVPNKGCLASGSHIERTPVDISRLAIVVPGDKLYSSMVPSEYTERSIQAMKAKLREKKNN